MDRLWTPWRYQYITGTETESSSTPPQPRRKGIPRALDAWPADQDKHCVFCNIIAAVDYAISQDMPAYEAEKAVHILQRGETCFLCLNAYPYGTGHIMIVPYQHLDSLAELPPTTAQELIFTAQSVEAALRQVYHPDGLNLGMNLGQAAGAGIADHLHLHGLPRWTGDVNFMTSIADTRVLPETLDVTWSRLRQALNVVKLSSKATT